MSQGKQALQGNKTPQVGFLLAFDFGFFVAEGNWFYYRGWEVALAAVPIDEIGELQAEVAGVRRIGESGFDIYDCGANQLFDFSVEILHAFRVAIAHGIE